ncbi:MAG TPA: M56 family metallopeptidase, partial [Armatimonadaceae bacterium]|nr:M56 family metallopeptidase [Armatimonadaceae bacterium]
MDYGAFPLLLPLSESAARFSEAAVASLLSALARTTVVLILGLLLGAYLERRAGGGVAPVVRAALYRVTLAATGLVLLATITSGGVSPASATPPLVRVQIPGVPEPVRELLPRLLMVRELRTFAQTGSPVGARNRVVMVRGGRTAPGYEPSASRLPGIYAGLVALYGLGASFLLSTLALGVWQLRRLARAAQPLPGDTRLAAQMKGAWQAVHPASPAGKRPLPRLVAAPDLDGPFIADSPALPVPTVFVPTGAADEWTEEEARGIFAHELAHHARRDGAWNLAARVLTALLWCQPLMHLLRRRLEEATEEACDQEALSAGGCAPQSLARCLLALAERRNDSRGRGYQRRTPSDRLRGLVPTLGAVSSPFRSSVGRRVERILASADRGERPRSAFSARLALGLM